MQELIICVPFVTMLFRFRLKIKKTLINVIFFIFFSLCIFNVSSEKVLIASLG